ncbi:MAG: glycosyltransferase family 39 protein [Candidatus Omnitrophica bacterium]|nr:glycosyltransferase family 39 protein [Candidatus Omnitrophota bacterium]
MFNFYPPFFYLVGDLFLKVFHNATFAINMTCVLFWAVSGIGMYFFAREFFNSRRGGLLSAIAYMYAPYHIQDLYDRGAFAEFSAFAFFPLILLSFLKLSQKFQMRYVVLGVLGVCGLSLTHNVMTMIFFPIAVFYIVFLSLLRKNVHLLWVSAAMIVLGLMMSAFFWLPAFSEKTFLNIIFLFFLHYEFHQSFLTLGHLLNTPWGVHPTDMTTLPYHIGLFTVILALMPLFFIARDFQKRSSFYCQYLFFFVVTLMLSFLTLPLSQSIWQSIIALRFIQFPWRFLAVISFTVSLMAGGAMTVIQSKKLSNGILAISILLIMISSIKLLYPVAHGEINDKSLYDNISDVTFLGEGEYTPKWIYYPPTKRPSQKFQFVQGIGEFLEYKQNTSVNHSVKVMAFQPSLICFHSFYFPGWRAFVDGKEVAIDSSNKFGLILFSVPQGEHLINVVFSSTPVRKIAGIFSWAGLCVFISGIIIYILRKRFKYSSSPLNEVKA